MAQSGFIEFFDSSLPEGSLAQFPSDTPFDTHFGVNPGGQLGVRFRNLESGGPPIVLDYQQFLVLGEGQESPDAFGKIQIPNGGERLIKMYPDGAYLHVIGSTSSSSVQLASKSFASWGGKRGLGRRRRRSF